MILIIYKGSCRARLLPQGLSPYGIKNITFFIHEEIHLFQPGKILLLLLIGFPFCVFTGESKEERKDFFLYLPAGDALFIFYLVDIEKSERER